ncbi:MAG: mechanosensitive ion channel family protein [Sandaracinaceae bacterium]
MRPARNVLARIGPMSPRPRPLALLLGTAAALLAAAASPACAQEVSGGEAVQQLLRVIRWSGVATSVLVVLGAWFLLRVVRNFVLQLSEQFPARRLFLQQAKTVLQFAVYLLTATLVTVLSIQVDQTVLALIGGGLAVSFGFAIRDLVASFVAGIMIMVDRPFQVGDRVAFGGEYGDITAIGLRSVRLQTLDDNTVTIPNNKFITDITSCANYGALSMMVVVDFFVGVDQDIDEAREVVREAALASRFVHLERKAVVLVTQRVIQDVVAVRLRLKAYVLDTRQEKAFESDVTLRALRELAKRGIAPPAVLHRAVEARAAQPPTQPPTQPPV